MQVDYYQIVTNLINALKISSWQQLVKEIRFKNGQLYYDLKTGKTKSISTDFVNKVITRFPQVSSNWLMTGTEPIFNEGNAVSLNGSEDASVNVKIENSAISNIDTANNCTINNSVYSKPESATEPLLGCMDGVLIPVDIRSIPKYVRLRDYCINNCDHDFDPARLKKKYTFAYQIKTNLLEPRLFKGDWLFVLRIEDKENLVSGRCYLVDCPTHGKMIKRLTITDSNYILALPDPKKDYPILEVEKDHDVDFYEIVSRLSNDIDSIFNDDMLDFQNMARTAIDTTNHLVKVLESIMSNSNK